MADYQKAFYSFLTIENNNDYKKVERFSVERNSCHNQRAGAVVGEKEKIKLPTDYVA